MAPDPEPEPEEQFLDPRGKFLSRKRKAVSPARGPALLPRRPPPVASQLPLPPSAPHATPFFTPPGPLASPPQGTQESVMSASSSTWKHHSTPPGTHWDSRPPGPAAQMPNFPWSAPADGNHMGTNWQLGPMHTSGPIHFTTTNYYASPYHQVTPPGSWDHVHGYHSHGNGAPDAVWAPPGPGLSSGPPRHAESWSRDAHTGGGGQHPGTWSRDAYIGGGQHPGTWSRDAHTGGGGQHSGTWSRDAHTGGGGQHPGTSSRDAARAPPKGYAPDTSMDAFATIDKHIGLYREHSAKLAEHTSALAGDSVPHILRASLDRKIQGAQRAMEQSVAQVISKLHKKLKFEKEGIKFERATPVLALHLYDLSTKFAPQDKHLTDAHIAKLAKARAPGGELHVAEAPKPPVVPVSPASPVPASPVPASPVPASPVPASPLPASPLPAGSPTPQRSPAMSRSPPKSRQAGDMATDSEPDDDNDTPIHGPENRSKQTRCQRGFRHQADCVWEDMQKEHRVTREVVETYSSDACSTCITFLPFTLYAWPIHPALQIVSGLRNQRKRWQRSYGCKHCRKTFPYFHAIRFQLRGQVRAYIDSQQLPEANWITFSHICGNKWCFKIEHIHLEPLDVNQGREDCFRKARRLFQLGQGHLAECTCGASPPCAVDECNMEFDAAFVVEWLNVNAGITLPLKKDYIAPALVGRGLQHGDFAWLMHEHGDLFLQDCRFATALSRDQMSFKYYSGGDWHDLQLPVMWRDNVKTAWLFHHEVESLATYSRAPKMSDLDSLLHRVMDFMTHGNGIPLDLSPWRAFTRRPSGDRKSLQVVGDRSVGYRYELCHVGFYQCRSTTERDQTNPSKRPYTSLRSIIEHVYLKHREVPRCLRASWLGTEIDVIEGLWDELVDMFPKVAENELPDKLVRELITGTFAPEIRVVAGDTNKAMNE